MDACVDIATHESQAGKLSTTKEVILKRNEIKKGDDQDLKGELSNFAAEMD